MRVPPFQPTCARVHTHHLHPNTLWVLARGQAIESEFERAKTNDACRRGELLCFAAKPEHPLSHFSWGNRSSLQTQPAAAGVDVRAQV